MSITEKEPRRVVAIIQGRMSSSRLPGKILMDLDGEPMLVRVVERVRMARTVDEVIVATTTDPTDYPAAELCKERGIACERGSLFDVLDRFYQAARSHQAEVVVRVTADCPLIDPWSSTAPCGVFRSRRRFCCQPPAAALETHLSHRPGCGSMQLCGARNRMARG